MDSFLKRIKQIGIFIGLSFFLNGIGLYAQTADEFMDLAKAKSKEGEFYDALVAVEKSINLDPLDEWKRILHSDILMGLGRYEEGVYQLGVAITIDSTNAEIYNRIGNFFLSSNDLENSVEFYSLAINYAESDSMSRAYYINRASAKGVLRDFDAAIEDFEIAYLLDSNDLVVINNLAGTFLEMGYKERALHMLKRLLELDSDFLGVYTNLGLIYSELDSLEQSEYYFDEALKIEPNEPLTLNNKGYLHYKKNEFQKALKYINMSIKIYPENSYAYRNRALVYLALDLKTEGCQDLKHAKEMEFHLRYGEEVNELIKEHCN